MALLTSIKCNAGWSINKATQEIKQEDLNSTFCIISNFLHFFNFISYFSLKIWHLASNFNFVKMNFETEIKLSCFEFLSKSTTLCYFKIEVYLLLPLVPTSYLFLCYSVLLYKVKMTIALAPKRLMLKLATGGTSVVSAGSITKYNFK